MATEQKVEQVKHWEPAEDQNMERLAGILRENGLKVTQYDDCDSRHSCIEILGKKKDGLRASELAGEHGYWIISLRKVIELPHRDNKWLLRCWNLTEVGHGED